jgi:isoquinoline 1-oxidoreductase alpha subunit
VGAAGQPRHDRAKFGCGIAACGACNVHVDGRPKRACATRLSSVFGARITTIEALQADRVGRAGLQEHTCR